MSLIVPTRFPNQELTEREALVRHGRTKAQKDFAQEEAENLIKKSYQEELDKLRNGGPPAGQSAKPTIAPTTRKESGMDTEKRVKEMTAAYMAQGPTPEPLKPGSPTPQPSPEVSEEEGELAVKVIETWKASVEAKKDFPNVVSFHAFCVECEEREIQLRPHQKGIVGLPFYQRSINLQKSPGSCR